MDYTIRIKHPYRGHHYILQNVLIIQAVQVQNSSPISGQTHDHCVCRYTAGCNAVREVCKLNLAHHLLSLSVLWQYSSCRGTWPPLNSGLMMWQPGQFSAFGNSLPSFFNHDQQQISCFVHGSKIANYHNAVAEDIHFIWQKIEINLT